jgi:hypothetical protein
MSLGTAERIRMGQWLTEIGLVMLVGSVVYAVAGKASQQPKKEPPKLEPS